MNLTISGHRLEVTPAMRDYIKGKLDRISHHFDNIIDMTVTLSVESLPEKEKRQKAEINVNMRGKSLHVESVSQDMYAAIDTLIDKLDRTVLKQKEKSKEHDRKSIKNLS